MLNKIIIGVGAALIGGYVIWSALGWELTSSGRDPVPTARVVQSSGSSSGRTGYFGTGRSGRSSGWGGFSFGK